jgi:hypothetical protein
MTPTLDLELLLPPLRAVTESASSEIGGLEARREATEQHLGRGLAAWSEFVRSVGQRWRAFCERIARGGASALLPLRVPFEATVEACRTGMKEMERIVERAEAMGLRPSHRDDFRRAVADLERVATVVPRWVSEEELERLAVEWLSIPQARLEELASRSPAPAEWYEQEGKPW